MNRDAEDAVKARDGYDYDGYRLRVEFPRGGGPGKLSNTLKIFKEIFKEIVHIDVSRTN